MAATIVFHFFNFEEFGFFKNEESPGLILSSQYIIYGTMHQDTVDQCLGVKLLERQVPSLIPC